MSTRAAARSVQPAGLQPIAIASPPSSSPVSSVSLPLGTAPRLLQPAGETHENAPATVLSGSETTPRADSPSLECAPTVTRSAEHAAAGAADATAGANAVAVPLSPSLSLDGECTAEAAPPPTAGSPLAALHMSCTEALDTALAKAPLPPFAAAAFAVCRPTRSVHDDTARARFTLAALLAVRASHEPTALLHHTPASLIAPESELHIVPGTAVSDGPLRALMRELRLPTALSGRLTSPSQKAAIDGAMRVLLRAMRSLDPCSVEVHATLHAFLDAALQTAPGTTAASAASAAAASSHPAFAHVSPPKVRVLPISGLAEQCFFRATGTALDASSKPHERHAGLQRWHSLARHIKDALDSIDSAPLLHHYGLADVLPDSSQMQVATAKERYFKSTEWAEQRWGGTLEMHLLSHHQQGALGFLIVTPGVDDPTLAVRSVCAARAGTPLPPLSSASPYSPPDGTVRPDREIALHFCSKSGAANSTRNHWELIQYTDSLAAAPVCIREDLQFESHDTRCARHAALLQACKAAAKRSARAAAAAEAADRAAAERLDRSLNSAPAANASAAAAVEMTVAGRVASPATALPCHSTRLRTWRTLPKRNRRTLVVVVAPLLERYAAASAADDREQCAELLHQLLDLPALALRKGPASQLNKSLRSCMGWFERVKLDSPAATAIASAPADTTDSAGEIPATVTPQPPPHAAAAAEESASDTDSDTPDDHTRAVRRAVAIVHEGGARALSRAANTLLQLPPVAVSADTVRQLQQLHPQASGAMCALPADSTPPLVAIELASLQRVLKQRVDNGSAPGPSGWSGSLLTVLASCGQEEVTAGLCALVRDICNGVFTGDAKRCLLASVLIPLSKSAQSAAVRPIAMGEVLVKLAAHYSMSLIEEHLLKLFSRIQYGVKRSGGSESAAQLVRAALDESARTHTDSVALALDFKNAFNASSRSKAWERILSTPDTKHIWRMFHWAYSEGSDLLLYDQSSLHSVLQSLEGVRQGCPFAAFAFALLVQPLYEAAIAGLPSVKAISVLDDITLIGPLQDVMTAFDRVQAQAATLGLQLQVPKCKLFIPPSSRARAESIRAAAAPRQLECVSSLLTLGVTHGDDSDVTEHCMSTAQSHESFFAALTHPAMPAQVAFSLLRYCAVPRMSFMARTVQPHLFRETAEVFDLMVRNSFAEMTRLERRIREDQPPHMSAAQLEQRVSLPISAGGMGLRPCARISHAAYFSSLAAVMPDFTALFPECSDYSLTRIHQQLDACRQHLLQQQADLQQSAPKLQQSPRKKTHRKGSAAAAASAPLSEFAATLTASVPRILSIPLPALWTEARSCAATGASPAEFLQADHLQKVLTQCAEDLIIRAHFASATRYQQTLLTSLTKTSGSSAFLTLLPVEPEYRMGSAEFRLAVRHRLGLVPFDCLLDETCRVCPAGTSFAADPDHFHACVKHRRTLVTARHSDLMAAVMSLARSVGFYASREPTDHARPAELEFRKDTVSIEEYNSHADILLLKHNLKIYVDVSVVRSTSPSKITKGRTDVPLAAATYRARDKHRKYDRICEVNGYTNIPFVLESNGGLSHEAAKLLRLLSLHSADISPREWLAHAHKVISVVLQRGNARLAQGGMHAQTICTTLWQRQRNSQQRWLQNRGLSASTSKTAVTASPARITHPRGRSSAAVQAAAADTTDESSISGSDSSSSSASSTDDDEPAADELQPSLSLPLSADGDFELSQRLPEQMHFTDPSAARQPRQLLVTVVSEGKPVVSKRITHVRLTQPD